MDTSKEISRRKFLTYLGTGAATLATASSGLGLILGPAPAQAADRLFDKPSSLISSTFHPIAPSSRDELVVPHGLTYRTIAAFGDRIHTNGDTFGDSSDFSCFFPIEGSAVHGLLYVSHDAPATGSLGEKENGHFSASQVRQLLYNQGGSVLEIYRNLQGTWTVETDSVYARRLTGLVPMELSGPARGAASVRTGGVVQGTIANRFGVRTLWDTVLSGEGRYDDTCREAGFHPTHYGWVIEVDPFDTKSRVRKHTALGRFRHGGMTMEVGSGGHLVIYMGDATNEACLYKFISKGKYQASRGKANSELLSEGTLYAADLLNGAWVELSAQAVQKRLRDHSFQPPAVLQRSKEALLELFQEEADVYVYAYEAAMILGATRMDPIGGIQAHPKTSDVYINVGSSPLHGNIYGYIAQLMERGQDAEALTFEYDVFSAGGLNSGFRSPGSSALESGENLWVTSQVPADDLNKGAAASLGNNGLYVLSTAEHTVNTSIQFASAPQDAQFVSPAFSEDGRTLFLSVQYSGANGSRSCIGAITG